MKNESPKGEILIEHHLINRKERRRREKLKKVKYTKRNKVFWKQLYEFKKENK